MINAASAHFNRLTQGVTQSSPAASASSFSAPLLGRASVRDPRVPFTAPAELTQWGARLDWCFAQPARPTSYRPLLLATMPGAGKLGMSYGATLIGRALAKRPASSWVPGAVVVAASTGLVLTGIVLLGNAVGAVSAPGGRYTKVASLSGGLLLALGYGLSGATSDHVGWPWAQGVSVSTKWLGAAMMAFTLPTFVVHAEAVFGDLPFHGQRGTVATALIMSGVATLIACMSIQTIPRVPLAASQALTVLATFACMVSAGIFLRESRPWPFGRQSPVTDLEHGPLSPVLPVLLRGEHPGENSDSPSSISLEAMHTVPLNLPEMRR